MPAKRTQPVANSENRQLQSGTYSLPETAQRLGIGTTTVYDLVRRGDQPFGSAAAPGPVPVHRIGGQMRTLVADVERFLAGATVAAS